MGGRRGCILVGRSSSAALDYQSPLHRPLNKNFLEKNCIFISSCIFFKEKNLFLLSLSLNVSRTLMMSFQGYRLAANIF